MVSFTEPPLKLFGIPSDEAPKDLESIEQQNQSSPWLLAFSCKRRHFCPFCHQKRVVEFGEWLCKEVLKAVPHRHFTFSMPKILRRYFLYDRKLLSELSRCAWDSLEEFLLSPVPKQEATPGAVIAIQTFGDFLNFNPHCHLKCLFMA